MSEDPHGEDMHDKHLENVLGFDEQERYTYFLTTVCGTEEVFGLWNEDGWLILEDEDKQRSAVPVWPHGRLAEACIEEGWEVEAQAMELDDWLALCDQFEQDGRLAWVMMYPDGSFLRVEPADLKRDLKDWLAQAYGDESD